VGVVRVNAEIDAAPAVSWVLRGSTRGREPRQAPLVKLVIPSAARDPCPARPATVVWSRTVERSPAPHRMNGLIEPSYTAGSAMPRPHMDDPSPSPPSPCERDSLRQPPSCDRPPRPLPPPHHSPLLRRAPATSPPRSQPRFRPATGRHAPAGQTTAITRDLLLSPSAHGACSTRSTSAFTPRAGHTITRTQRRQQVLVGGESLVRCREFRDRPAFPPRGGDRGWQRAGRACWTSNPPRQRARAPRGVAP